MKRCVIVAGGERAPIAPLREGDFLLACDRGLVYALEEGLRPDLILGDFDSYSGDLPPEIPVLRYPVEKDDTDAMLAVRWAMTRGRSCASCARASIACRSARAGSSRSSR